MNDALLLVEVEVFFRVAIKESDRVKRLSLSGVVIPPIPESPEDEVAVKMNKKINHFYSSKCLFQYYLIYLWKKSFSQHLWMSKCLVCLLQQMAFWSRCSTKKILQ